MAPLPPTSGNPTASGPSDSPHRSVVGLQNSLQISSANEVSIYTLNYLYGPYSVKSQGYHDENSTSARIRLPIR